MSSDACTDTLACIGCCCLLSGATDAAENIASKDRTVGIVLGILLGLGTIAACVALSQTTSTVFNRYSMTYQTISNARYIPVVAVIGGLLTLTTLGAAASAKSN